MRAVSRMRLFFSQGRRMASTIELRIASRPISRSMATLPMIRRSLLTLFARPRRSAVAKRSDLALAGVCRARLDREISQVFGATWRCSLFHLFGPWSDSDSVSAYLDNGSGIAVGMDRSGDPGRCDDRGIDNSYACREARLANHHESPEPKARKDRRFRAARRGPLL